MPVPLVQVVVLCHCLNLLPCLKFCQLLLFLGVLAPTASPHRCTRTAGSSLRPKVNTSVFVSLPSKHHGLADINTYLCSVIISSELYSELYNTRGRYAVFRLRPPNFQGITLVLDAAAKRPTRPFMLRMNGSMYVCLH